MRRRGAVLETGDADDAQLDGALARCDPAEVGRLARAAFAAAPRASTGRRAMASSSINGMPASSQSTIAPPVARAKICSVAHAPPLNCTCSAANDAGTGAPSSLPPKVSSGMSSSSCSGYVSSFATCTAT